MAAPMGPSANSIGFPAGAGDRCYAPPPPPAGGKPKNLRLSMTFNYNVLFILTMIVVSFCSGFLPLE